MINNEELQPILTELIVLTSGQPHLSDYLSELRDTCQDRPEQVQEMVSDLRLWGGMGSVADQAGNDLQRDGKSRVNELLINLYELLEANGIVDDRGASWVDTFRLWRDSDVFGPGQA